MKTSDVQFNTPPKPPQARISVLADLPVITVKDARPSSGGYMRGVNVLVPYGDDHGVILMAGVVVAQEKI